MCREIFLSGLGLSDFLNVETVAEMEKDQTPSDRVVFLLELFQNVSFHYGLGQWIECRLPEFDDSVCGGENRILSSPGIFGWCVVPCQ